MKIYKRMMNLGKYILSYVLVLFCTSAICHATTPSPTDAGTIFGPRPIFSPGGSIKVIVDDFGWIDYTVTPEQREVIKNSISDWESQGIGYGTYYALQHLETSAGDDPDLKAVALSTDLDGTTGSNFSIARQGALDYWIASGKLAIDLGTSYFFLDEAAGAISTLSFDSETVAAFNTYLTANYTAGEISAFDITDVSNFDYADHLRANGWSNSTQVQNDPPTDSLYKAWLAYMLSVERNFFNQWTTQLRAYGLANYNRTIYLSANRYTEARSWDILDLFDFGMAETFLDSLGWPYGHLAFVHKTIVNFDKKFWSWNFPAQTEATDSNESARLFAAETFAAGGLVQHGSGSSWSGFHHKKERMDFLRSFLQFPTLQPTAFNLSEAGQFAVLYSEIGEVSDPGSATSSFRGATYLLTDMQWMFDVIFAAHPNRRDGNELLTLAQLQLYDAVILPNTRYMTDAQIVLLEQYVNAGGILIGFGTIAKEDHTGQIRSGARSFDDYFGTDKVQAVGSGFIISFENNLGSNYESNKTSATSKSTIRESFSNLVDSRVSPEVGLTYSGSGTASGESPDVFVNRYKADDGSWVFHIVNRQIVIPTANPSQASMTPLENASLDVLLPTEFDSDTVSVSFVDADSPSVNPLSFETSGDRISFTLPTFSIWSVVRVGSAMPATGAYDEPPQSNPYFLGDVDNDGAGSTERPNQENASGEIRFPVWYWKGGNHGPVPWDVPFFATDDVGLKKGHLYYRYSSDESTWGDWSLYESTDLSGTLVYGNFSFTAPDGEGFYELYTQVVDTSDQEETISPWAENGYGVDQTGPGHPTNATASNDIKNGYWTTDMDDLAFTWESAVDNLSGVEGQQVSIRYGAGSAIFLKNLGTATTWTPSTSDEWDDDWSTDLMNLGTAYRLEVSTSDTAGNWNSGHSIFDLLYGESPVADVVNPAVVEGDSKLTISWEAPSDPNYIGMVVRVRPASGTSWVESGFAPVDEASQLMFGGLENKVAYTVRVVAYAADNKEGNYVTLPNTYTPDVEDPVDPVDPGDLGTGDDNVLNAGEVINFNSTTVGIYTLEDFGGNISDLVADPTDATNTVVSIIKGNQTWAGTTITSGSVIYPLTATETIMTVRVWSPEAGITVRLKLEESGDATHTVETDAVTTKAQEWETLTFDFSNPATNDGNPTNPLNTAYVFDKLSIFMNFGSAGSSETYYFDDVTFVGAGAAASAFAGPWEGFGGATADNDTSTFRIATGSEGWAGFANLNVDLYPFSFANGGTITFTGSVPSGGDVDAYFRFERLPHPEVEPAFNTGSVTVSGAVEATYTVAIAAQDAANTFSSFLMYLTTLDVDVVIKDVKVTAVAPIDSVDTDADGTGNNADTDDDNDSVLDSDDAFPLDATESVDTDSDGTGNNADTDDDNDTVLDSDDAFPLDATESVDTDLDGIGNNADTDDDNDGVEDNADAFPTDASETSDMDGDGTGDNTDSDIDGDGVSNSNDPFPNQGQYKADSDGDGMPDAWETKYGLDPNDPSDATSDQDNDGVTALDEFLAGTIPSGSLDIDGNEKYDALTDGLLLLRGMFGLDGSALVTGTIASDAAYTESADIESRIATLGDLADIDGNGDIDALTDGLLTLRYLFGLQGDTLINGVVADDATRKTAEEIEAHLKTLMPAL
ncbi:MAG: hypothetical protein O3C55_10595 [Proteobacteria bacterium]|nr:hypothetical protein [Pseudomonadota bacterium]